MLRAAARRAEEGVMSEWATTPLTEADVTSLPDEELDDRIRLRASGSCAM
jgi:hypothetical protein